MTITDKNTGTEYNVDGSVYGMEGDQLYMYVSFVDNDGVTSTQKFKVTEEDEDMTNPKYELVLG